MQEDNNKQQENIGDPQIIKEDKDISDILIETPKDQEIEIKELKDRYLRLYAEFDNYKKKTIKDKEEFFKYANEDLIYELLSVIDNLEMALKHTDNGNNDTVQSLVKGVENTLRGLLKILEKFGLALVKSNDNIFNPSIHHAASQVENNELEENTIVEELRKGYTYKEKVLRPSLVIVSKKSKN